MLLSSSIWRRPFSTSGASRRRMPILMPHPRVFRVLVVHVVALRVGHHLERQLVMVAQEHRPLADSGMRRRLLHDLDDRQPLLAADRHEDARHEREIERHMELVAVAEVRDGVGGPLIRLREQDSAGIAAHPHRCGHASGRRASPAGSRSWSLPLEEIGHGIAAEAVQAEIEPEADRCRASPAGRRDFVVEVRLIARRSDASSTGRPPGPRSSSRSRCP